MEHRFNNLGDGITPERQVELLLRRYHMERNKGWDNVKLKDVPIGVIWNTFSRSNWRLPTT